MQRDRGRDQPKMKPATAALLSQAADHHKRGALEKAEQLYRRVLKASPGNPDALHLSGVVAHQVGRHHRAAQLITKAIRQDGGQAVFHTNLAGVYIALGEWDDAEAACRAAIALRDDDPKPYHALGEALEGRGDFGGAAEALESGLLLEPANAAVRVRLASIRARSGNLVGAIAALEETLEREPSHVQAMSELAAYLTSAGRADDGEGYARRAIQIEPSRASSHHVLGISQAARQLFPAAIDSFKRAAALNRADGDTESHVQRGRAIRLHLATALAGIDRFDEAAIIWREIIQEAPESAKAHYALGLAHADRGERDEATTCFRAAVDADPHHIDAYYALGTSGRSVLTADDLAVLAELSTSDGLTPDDRAKTLFAIASEVDRQDDMERAFDAFARANSLRRAALEAHGRTFDREAHLQWIEQIEALFDADWLEQHAACGRDDQRPVFVVGVPRSGTTLVERIAAAHPDVAGAGELDDVPTFVNGLAGLYPASAVALAPGPAQDFSAKYIERLSALDANASRVIDKLPENAHYLGVIAALFPRARVIACSRDPRDTGLSCFVQNFTRGHAWSHDLGDIATYIRGSERLMEHWRRNLPLEILDVRYEDTVADQEAASRRIIEFLGLPWDPVCLDFHTTGDVVRTASKWQVREPIYNRSVGRWQKYEAHLGPLIEALDAD